MKTKGIAGLGTVVLGLLIASVVGIAAFDWQWGRDVLAPLCHQKSERCFSWGTVSWPICSRCFGIYGGLFAGCAVYWGSAFRLKRSGGLLLTALALNGLDFALEQVGVYENANWIHWGVGTALGFSLPIFVFSKEEKLPSEPDPNGKA